MRAVLALPLSTPRPAACPGGRRFQAPPGSGTPAARARGEAPQVPRPRSSAAPAAAAFAAGRRGCWGPGGEGPRLPAEAHVGKRGGRSRAGSRKHVRGGPASGPAGAAPRPPPTVAALGEPHAGSAPAARGGLSRGQLPPLQKPGQWD